MTVITVDFETRSACDLKKSGAWVYAEHPTTEVLCVVFVFGDAANPKANTWQPGDPEPPWLRRAIAEGRTFAAHNVLFEKRIWREVMVRQHDWPEVPDEQWVDTMASCARRALPLDLESASRLLDLDVVKDTEGAKAMKMLCKPRKVKRGQAAQFVEDADLREKLLAYCVTDGVAQHKLGARLGPLEPQEQKVWALNQRMNNRGLGIDLAFAADMQATYDAAIRPLAAEFDRLTGGVKPRSPAVKDFINDLMDKHDHDKMFGNLQGDTVTEALTSWDLPKEVHTILTVRSALTSASVAKLAAMRAATGEDGRAHGLLQYHAATTGRDGGRLIQPTNFPRGSVELGKDENGDDIPPHDFLVPAIQMRDVETIGMVLAHLEERKGVAEEYWHLIAPVSAVTSALRHVIHAAPGNLLVAADFSTIEARVVLALAGQHDILAKMANPALKYDPYCDLASMVLGRPINKQDNKLERQEVGKPTVLGCGFQMGVNKFHSQYMKDKPRELAQQCVDTYRKEWAPNVPKLWYGLQEAATKAVWDGGAHEYAGIVYRVVGRWLTAHLPSDRKLFYFDPRKVTREMPWSTEEEPDFRPGFTYGAKKMGKWVRVDAYGGLLTENAVQAIARDILYNRALVLDEEGFPLVLNVYDECVADVPEARADHRVMEEIMCDAVHVDWIKSLGVPIAAEGWTGERYRK